MCAEDEGLIELCDDEESTQAVERQKGSYSSRKCRREREKARIACKSCRSLVRWTRSCSWTSLLPLFCGTVSASLSSFPLCVILL